MAATCHGEPYRYQDTAHQRRGIHAEDEFVGHQTAQAEMPRLPTFTRSISHEGMTATRTRILEEIGRFEQNGPAVRALDLPRIRRLAENWPHGGLAS